MITVIHKLKKMAAYNLECAIPLRDGKPEEVEGGYMKVPTERVLTLLPNEVRQGLPDAVAASAHIKKAVENGWIVIKQEKIVQKDKGAKPSAAPKAKEGAK